MLTRPSRRKSSRHPGQHRRHESGVQRSHRRRELVGHRPRPIDPVTSTVDHFLPGLTVDPTTSGGSTHLALTYYFYPNAACGGARRLQVGYISSPDGRAHCGAATKLAGPIALSEIAATSQGPMVGDYISTSSPR